MPINILFKKLIISSIFFLAAATAFSQKDNAPTPFDKFIASKKVPWAAAFVTPFENNDLKKNLISAFKENNIKGYKGISFRYPDANNLQPVNYADLQKTHTYDPLPQNNEAFNNLTAQQVLFLYKKKIYSYVPWINITALVTTPGGTYLGIENLLSTAFSKKHCRSKLKNADSVGTSFFYIPVDSVPKSDQLKSLYGNNFVDAIWPLLEAGNFSVYYASNGSPVRKNENAELLGQTAVAVPVVDENGKMGSKINYGTYRPGHFSRVSVKQNWYYDAKKKIMLSRITEIILYSNQNGLTNEPRVKDGYSAILKVAL